MCHRNVQFVAHPVKDAWLVLMSSPFKIVTKLSAQFPQGYYVWCAFGNDNVKARFQRWHVRSDVLVNGERSVGCADSRRMFHVQ